MTLLERIERDLFEARKSRDGLALGTLGLLKAEIVNAGKEPGVGGAPADDESVIRVVRKEVKKREEAARAYRDAGRAEPAAKEEAEAEVLRGYLPAEMSEAELEAELRQVIAEVKPQGPRDFGAVMKAAAGRLRGRADGGRIAAVAKRLLA